MNSSHTHTHTHTHVNYYSDGQMSSGLLPLAAAVSWFPGFCDTMPGHASVLRGNPPGLKELQRINKIDAVSKGGVN